MQVLAIIGTVSDTHQRYARSSGVRLLAYIGCGDVGVCTKPSDNLRPQMPG
jgi:hypothetical protein